MHFLHRKRRPQFRCLLPDFSVWRVVGPCLGSKLQSPQPDRTTDQPRPSRDLEEQAAPDGCQQCAPPAQAHHVLAGSPRTSLHWSGVVPLTGRHGVERIGLDQSFLVQPLRLRFRACQQETVLFVANIAFGMPKTVRRSSRGRSSSWSCKAFRMSLSSITSRLMLCPPVVDCKGWFQVATRHHAKAITSGWSAPAVTIGSTSN